MVWKQTYCTASSRIKALQRPEKKRYSDQEGKKGRMEEMKAKRMPIARQWARRKKDRKM